MKPPSPRLLWVARHAAELTAIAADLGASGVCLCGSVARGDDTEGSDIDFYVREFREGSDGRDRADQLVNEFRDRCPFEVDVRPLPGWLLDAEHEATMQRDAVPLEAL